MFIDSNHYLITVEYIIFITLALLTILEMRKLKIEVFKARAFLDKNFLFMNLVFIIIAGSLLAVHEFIEMSIENGVLTVKGQMAKKSEVEEKNYYRKEVRAGSFYRSVVLPTRVVGDQAKATHPTIGRLQADHAAEPGRLTDTAAGIGAKGVDGFISSHGNGRATTAAAGNTV